jgi:hypothetical protein
MKNRSHDHSESSVMQCSGSACSAVIPHAVQWYRLQCSDIAWSAVISPQTFLRDCQTLIVWRYNTKQPAVWLLFGGRWRWPFTMYVFSVVNANITEQGIWSADMSDAIPSPAADVEVCDSRIQCSAIVLLLRWAYPVALKTAVSF